MKKSIKSGIIAILALAACSCNQFQKGIHPMTTSVSGDLSKCYEVVDRAYTIVENYSSLLTVELKRTDEPLPFDTEDLEIISFSHTPTGPNVQIGFGIEFRDKDGNVLDKVPAVSYGANGSYSSDDPVELGKLRPGETGTIRFVVEDGVKASLAQFKILSAFKVNWEPEDSVEEEEKEEDDSVPGTYPEGSTRLLSEEELENYDADELRIMRNEIFARHGYIFRTDDMSEHFASEPWYEGTIADASEVSRQFSDIEKKNVETIKAAEKKAPASSSLSSSSSSNAGSSDWDELLDRYERLMDKYVALYKKAMFEDASALSECMSVMEDAQKLQEQLEKAANADNLTMSQAERLNKIMAKAAAAAL